MNTNTTKQAEVAMTLIGRLRKEGDRNWFSPAKEAADLIEQQAARIAELEAAAPSAPAQSGEADRRADVAKALGLPHGSINGQKIGFAWEYLLNSIEQLRAESERSAVVLDDERAAFDDWWERRGPEAVNHAWTEDACWFAWQARAASPQPKGEKS